MGTFSTERIVLDRIGVAREKKDVTFVTANGQHITRAIGFAVLRVQDRFTIDEVVFAEQGDLMLLRARTLEGLNLVVDTQRKKLVAAGPIPVAGSSCGRSLHRFQRPVRD